MKGPKDRLMAEQKKRDTGTHSFTAEDDGRYTYCFSNEMSTLTGKTVSFNVHGVMYVEDDGHTAPIEKEIRALAQALEAVKDEQEYIVVRERLHRDTAESTNDRVKWWSIIQTVVVFAVCGWQIFYLKRSVNGLAEGRAMVGWVSGRADCWVWCAGSSRSSGSFELYDQAQYITKFTTRQCVFRRHVSDPTHRPRLVSRTGRIGFQPSPATAQPASPGRKPWALHLVRCIPRWVGVALTVRASGERAPVGAGQQSTVAGHAWAHRGTHDAAPVGWCRCRGGQDAGGSTERWGHASDYDGRQ